MQPVLGKQALGGINGDVVRQDAVRQVRQVVVMWLGCSPRQHHQLVVNLPRGAVIAHREVDKLIHLLALEFRFENFVAQHERVDEHARNVERTFKQVSFGRLGHRAIAMQVAIPLAKLWVGQVFVGPTLIRLWRSKYFSSPVAK